MGFEIESEKKTTIFFFNRKKCYSMREGERERERGNENNKTNYNAIFRWKKREYSLTSKF